MTKTQKEVIATVAREGVALFNTSKRPQAIRTAKSLQLLGYTYYWTGTHLAIARYAVCAKMAVTFANHRCNIRLLDAAKSDWERNWRLSDNTFSAPSINPIDRILYRDVMYAEKARKGYLLNTKMSALTRIPQEGIDY
jgi:hypothetical protein